MKKKILIISIIALIVALIGSTYAFFMYSKTIKAFTLTSGDINIEFVNGDNNINLTYAYPISDNYAKANLEKLGYIDFSVNGTITEDKKVINYEIYLEEDSGNTLDSNYIKVYLTDDTNKEIVSPKTFNSLDKTSYANAENGKIIYKTSKHGEFNDKYRIYVWIDSGYTQNVIQERFSFKVNLYAYNDNGTAVSVIKSKLVKYEESSKDTFTGGLVAVNTDGELYNETDDSQVIREYRYSGPSVNNYVTFNDETWRIIGVFKDEKGEEHVKIIKNGRLNEKLFPENYIIEGTTYNIKATGTYAYWNKKTTGINNNDWTTAGIQYFLNTENDGQGHNGYLNYLKTDSKNMVQTTKYYLGNVVYSSGIIDTPKQAYINERDIESCIDNTGKSETESGCKVYNGNKATWTGKVALLYPSDYGYSASFKNWDIQLRSFNVLSTSWIGSMPDNAGWLLSPTTQQSEFVSMSHDAGYLISYNSYNGSRIIPILYLKNNVKITEGDGTQGNQYKLSLD